MTSFLQGSTGFLAALPDSSVMTVVQALLKGYINCNIEFKWLRASCSSVQAHVCQGSSHMVYGCLDANMHSAQMLIQLPLVCRLLQAESELNEASSGSPRSSLSSQSPDTAMRRATSDSTRTKQPVRAPVKIAAHSPSRVQPSSKPSMALKNTGVAAGLTHRRSGIKSSHLPGSSTLSAAGGSTSSTSSSPSRSRPGAPSKLGGSPSTDPLKSQVIALCSSENTKGQARSMHACQSVSGRSRHCAVDVIASTITY